MFEKIKEIVADQLGIDAEDIKLESNFKEDLEADSLDLFELVMSLEEEYGWSEVCRLERWAASL